MAIFNSFLYVHQRVSPISGVLCILDPVWSLCFHHPLFTERQLPSATGSSTPRRWVSLPWQHDELLPSPDEKTGESRGWTRAVMICPTKENIVSFGKVTNSYGKITMSIGKSTINGPCSSIFHSYVKLLEAIVLASLSRSGLQTLGAQRLMQHQLVAFILEVAQTSWHKTHLLGYVACQAKTNE